jgi:hypothetical protein
LADGTILDLEHIQKINKKLLLSLKFNTVPSDLQIVFSDSFPTVDNQGFLDIKYLKKTNEAVR